MSFIPTNKILSQVTGAVSTTDATVTTVVQVPTYINTGVVISAEVIGTRTGGSAGNPNDMIVVRLFSQYKNIDDVVTLFGTDEKYSDKDNNNCDVNLVISGTDINVRVTGDASNNYDWSAKATFFALSMGNVIPPPSVVGYSARFATPATAVPSGTITYGSPSNGDTIIITGLPTDGTLTFTKDDSTDFSTTFSTIAELSDLFNQYNDLAGSQDGSEVTITVYPVGTIMNSATITGTGSYAALNITFSGGVSGLLTATDPTSIAASYADSFIVGFWIQLDSYPAGVLIKKDDGWSNGDNFVLSIDNSGNIQTHTRVAAAGGQGFGGGSVIPLNTPTFVTYWKDATGDVTHPVLNISVNGEAPSTFVANSNSFTAGAGDFVLGTDGPVGGQLGNYINGRLDEVFYCKNPADMSAAIALINSTVYNNGAGAQYSDLSSSDKTTIGLQNWWTMDEASGDRVDEQNGVDLTPNSDISQDAPIVTAGASARNPANSGNWLDAGTQPSLRALQNDSILLAGWVILKDSNEGYILACGDDYNGNGADYGLYVSAGSGVITWGINSGGNPEAAIDSTPLTVDIPSFIFAWYDSGTGDFGIQVDNGTPNTNNTTRTADPSGSGLFNMFANGVGDGSIGGNMILDEWLVGKNPANMATAISTVQSSIYNGGIGKHYSEVSSGDKTAIGLVSWWGLNETTDVTRNDLHGTNNLTNNGDIQKAPPIVPGTPAPFSASTSPDSANFLSATDPTSLRANSTDTMIFGYWINVNNANNNGILWKTDPNPSGSNYYLSTEGGGHPELLFCVDNSGSSAQVDSSVVVTTGTNHFVLCWIDPATTSLNIQVDGGSVDSSDYSGVAGTLTAGAGDFLVCKSGDNNLLLDGSIDELFVCKNPSNLATAISTIQSSIYNGGSGKRYHNVTPTEKTDIGLISWWGMDEATNTTRKDLHGNNDLANNGTVSQTAPLVP